MADAKKCDICGKFYMPQLGIMNDNGYYLGYDGGFIRIDRYDLCPDCNKKLNEFVESMKENNHD